MTVELIGMTTNIPSSDSGPLASDQYGSRHVNDAEISLSLQELPGTDWQLVAFDLDDTLAPSKSELPPEMARALRDLLDVCEVAVISGGALPQFEAQLLTGLQATPKQLQRLHLLPTCGTRYLDFPEGHLVQRYAHDLSEQQRCDVTTVLEEVAKEQGIWEEETWGPILEDRGSQITYSALGQEAPLEIKRAWDPSGEKKNRLAAVAGERLPALEVRSGGSTSVDVTEKGIDKAYGMQKLVEITGIPKDLMLFIGDRLDPIGNDYPVKASGWPTYSVGGWEDTVVAVDSIVQAKRKDASS